MSVPSSSASAPPGLSSLEKTVLVHVTVLILGSTWAFGGNIWWARIALGIWASFALPLTIAGFLQRDAATRLRRKILWLLPAFLYAGLVVASTFNPSFSAATFEGETLMAHKGADRPGWPSTVSPALSLKSLWFGAGVYLSAFNVALVLRSRAGLRFIFVAIAVNTLALAVFGTLQKLAGAGYYFGAAVSPNIRFFSTFIYNNHWGAFMVLSLATSAGLLFYHARKHQGRDLWHSPFSLAVVGLLLIAATAPVSASRAATGMAAVLVVVVTAHALSRIASARRREQRSATPAIALLLTVVLAAVTAIGWLGLRPITQRFTETRRVIDQDKSIWGERAAVYRDTWELASRQPVFGWGLNSYSVAFQLIRPRPIQAHRLYESSYDTAHNDWLQSLAETGFTGTALLLAVIVIPLAGLPRRQLAHPLVAYPLAGLGLVLLYAWVEFPFSSGAVLVTFWLLFFTTLRHAELTDIASRNRHE